MSTGITKLMEDAESLADQRRLMPAIQLLEEARMLTKIADRRALITYNIGAIQWHLLGNGIAARREFLATISEFEKSGYGQNPNLKIVHANAIENAMLNALSFDEFENFAAKLNALTPEIPILTGLVPEVKNWRERGDSWSDRLFSFASSYYNRNDPRRDVGRYGEARSTYHLMLTNRRQLRVTQENFRMALFEFCALSMRMAADCIKVRGGDNDLNSPEEFLPILTEAIPIVDQYLSINSGDNAIKKVRGDIKLMINVYRSRWNKLNKGINLMSKKTDYQVCQQCGAIYTRREVNGPDFIAGMMDIIDHSTMCPKCGGNVKWQSKSEIEAKNGRGCLPVIILMGLFVALAICRLT